MIIQSTNGEANNSKNNNEDDENDQGTATATSKADENILQDKVEGMKSILASNNGQEHQQLDENKGCESSSSPAANMSSCTPSNATTEQQATSCTKPSSSSSVQVAVRIRPLLFKEADTDICIRVLPPNRDSKTNQLVNRSLQIGGSQGPCFTFDQVFHNQTKQEELFQARVKPLVESCIQGYNATIFAYGQTGSGKTHTIMGDYTTSSRDISPDAGVIPRALQFLFQGISKRSTVRIQFLELYGEEIRDLLATHNSATASSSSAAEANLSVGGRLLRRRRHGAGSGNANKLSIREVDDEPEVVGATHRIVNNASEALVALTHGMLRRVTAATAMNATSSRSHAILSIMVEQPINDDRETSSNEDDDDNNNSSNEDDDDGDAADDDSSPAGVKTSKFHFVDLAGSERQKRTQAIGQRLKEGIDINKGLLVLGNVISALGDPRKQGSHVPYRDSKLTRLLKGSLGGNHKTLMIACVSPSSLNLDESLNCLRYANRARNIQNNAMVNVDPTSRLVAELKRQVQALATELLQAWDGETSDTASPKLMSRDTVKALAAGMVASTPLSVASENNPAVGNMIKKKVVSGNDASCDTKMDSTTALLEIELSRTRDTLRNTMANHDAAEEQLYIAKAEKELYQMQLSVFTNSGQNGTGISEEFQACFLDKARAYEAEIGQLQAQLREAQTKAKRMDWFIQEASSSDSASNHLDGDAVMIAHVKRQLENDRQRLASIEENFSLGDSAMSPINLSANDRQDDEHEEQAELAHLKVLTKKYLGNDDSYDERDADDEDERPDDGRDHEGQDKELSPLPDQRHLRADLIELSRSIAAKEDLIDQLQVSQEKYAGMRDFYEERLKQMEDALLEKETERAHLVKELHRTKDGETPNKEIKKKLAEKDEHISDLRMKQKELREISGASARNSMELNRLKNEVSDMKRKKVELQKQLGQERKNHATEKKQFQRDAIQKDREVNKWKRVVSQKEMQAQKASQVAKARLDELGQLKSKYKDAEKKLRIMSLKRGVMQKAGLEPVLVGRRLRDTEPNHHFLNGANKKQKHEIDPDSLRDLFDKKVADVVRKEAIADKLAQEWEEHFELTTKRQELVDAGSEDLDTIQSFSVQIRFKEERIRQFATRLSKRKRDTPANLNEKDCYLFDQEFTKACSGIPEDISTKAAAKVLFGMVVRERRRVASLARTASSLDERAQSAEREATMHEQALHSYIEEQRRELAALSESQKQQILSLTDFVRGSAGNETRDPDEDPFAHDSFGPKLLVLANERIAILERQLEDMGAETETSDLYRCRVEELQSQISEMNQDKYDLEEEISGLRSIMRQIRETMTREEPDCQDMDVNEAILDIISDALHPRITPTSSKAKKNAFKTGNGRSSRMISPRLKKHVELMHTSDSEDAEDAPEWASDIMADLALISEGTRPPWIGDAEDFDAQKLVIDCTNIPEFPEYPSPARKPVMSRAKSPRDQAERKAMSKHIADRLEKIVVPDEGADDGRRDTQIHHRSTSKGHSRSDSGFSSSHLSPSSSHESESQSSGHQNAGKDNKAVFERLASPSHYTGTHKEKFKKRPVHPPSTSEHGFPKAAHAGHDSASRLLDNLLEADGEHGHPYHKEFVNSEKIANYTKVNVFERLTRTTTQAYAVKHSNSSEYDRLTPIGNSGMDGKDDSTVTATASTTSDRSEKSKQSPKAREDVFTRLSRTTTEAYAKDGKDESTVTAISSTTAGRSEKSKHSQKTREDVFTRLNRTTTEAYAKKAMAAVRHDI